MEILINGNNASDFILQANKVQWKVYRRKVTFALLLISICGLIFFIAGLSQGYGISESDYKYDKNFTVSYVHTVQYNYHIILGLGIAFMLFSIYLAFIYLVVQRKKILKAVNTIAYRHKNAADIYTIRINDDGIYFKDFEIIREEKYKPMI